MPQKLTVWRKANPHLTEHSVENPQVYHCSKMLCPFPHISWHLTIVLYCGTPHFRPTQSCMLLFHAYYIFLSLSVDWSNKLFANISFSMLLRLGTLSAVLVFSSPLTFLSRCTASVFLCWVSVPALVQLHLSPPHQVCFWTLSLFPAWYIFSNHNHIFFSIIFSTQALHLQQSFQIWDKK